MYNVKKAFKNDGTIRVFIVNSAVLIILGVVIAIAYQDIMIYSWFFLGGIIVGILLFIRTIYLKNFMKDYDRLQATVKNSFYYRGSKVITVEYIYQDKNYKRRILLNYTKDTKSIDKGSTVNLIIQPNKPKRVLIPELYLD